MSRRASAPGGTSWSTPGNDVPTEPARHRASSAAPTHGLHSVSPSRVRRRGRERQVAGPETFLGQRPDVAASAYRPPLGKRLLTLHRRRGFQDKRLVTGVETFHAPLRRPPLALMLRTCERRLSGRQAGRQAGSLAGCPAAKGRLAPVNMPNAMSVSSRCIQQGRHRTAVGHVVCKYATVDALCPHSNPSGAGTALLNRPVAAAHANPSRSGRHARPERAVPRADVRQPVARPTEAARP